jgi:hypothetical protein
MELKKIVGDAMRGNPEIIQEVKRILLERAERLP